MKMEGKIKPQNICLSQLVYPLRGVSYRYRSLVAEENYTHLTAITLYSHFDIVITASKKKGEVG